MKNARIWHSLMGDRQAPRLGRENSIYPVGLLGFALLNPTYKGDSKDQLPRSIAQSTNRLGFVPPTN